MTAGRSPNAVLIQKVFRVKISPLRWTLPFIAFFAGYWLCSLLMHRRQVMVPSLVGKSLDQALELASNNSLSVRLSAHKIRSDIPAGLVLDQIPQAGIPVNIPHLIGLTVSRRPTVPHMPLLIGKKEAELKQWAVENGYTLDAISVKSNYPAPLCCAHVPQAGMVPEATRLKVYYAAPVTTQIIMPSFIGRTVAEVSIACSGHDLVINSFHREAQVPDHHVCADCMVIDQLPAAGTVVPLRNLKNIHVQVVLAP